jgi:hypothetical protein
VSPLLLSNSTRVMLTASLATEAWRGYQDDEEEELADYVSSLLYLCTCSATAREKLTLEAQQYQQTTEAFLFLIEATPTMLDTSQRDSLKSAPGALSQSTQLGWKGRDDGPPKDAQSKLELALRAALAMMKRKVISNPKDLFGIIIFNTVSLQCCKSSGGGS